MSAHAHILVVDDEPDIRGLVQDILEDEGYQVTTAENADAARDARRAARPDLILLDIWMPGTDGISLLKEWLEQGGLPCPVIMISGHGNVETAVEATRLGAYDFLEKPLSLAKLLVTVENALRTEQLSREVTDLKVQTRGSATPQGSSQVVSNLRDQLQRIGAHDTSVLLTGEPGCGKATCARYLHANSARSENPFVEVGVASIAPENSAVELFGSEDGQTINYGLLEKANGGSLYLDEVADMGLETQARLLSALETGSFLRIGGSAPVKIDIRVIAATRHNLAEQVEEGHFRDDLYFKLNVVPLRIPALREHREDIAELLDIYIERFVTNEHLPRREFTAEAREFLLQYDWPGNIRELKNFVQRLLILGGTEHIGVAEVQQALGNAPQLTGDHNQVAELDLPLREAREQFEKRYLEQKLAQCGGNVGQLAKAAGMERTHVYRKLRGLGIEIRDRK